MELSELFALLTPEGLRLLDATAPLLSTDAVARTVSGLRASGHSPELVSAVVSQARLREKARPKFGDMAARMLFTRAALEQATRMSVAVRHAARFSQAGVPHVADLGCGLGADSLGFAGAGMRVSAVDADEVTAAIAAYNLAPFGDSVDVSHRRAEDSDVSASGLAVWLDPARRAEGHNASARTRSEDWSPPLEWALDLAARIPAGIKLGPGLDRELIPRDVEAQWLSADGSTIELVLWSGMLARPAVRRAALVIRGDHAWELTAPGDAEDEPTRSLGEFVHEPDGAVIRARLIGNVARALEAGMLADKVAYLTSEKPLTSPFVASFRVREVLPADTKALAKALRAREIGTLEIKKRGVDINPATLRTALKLRGDHSATLLMTRIKGKRIAILADRVTTSTA